MFKEVTITMTYIEWKQLQSFLDDIYAFDNLDNEEDDTLAMVKFEKKLQNIEAE